MPCLQLRCRCKIAHTPVHTCMFACRMTFWIQHHQPDCMPDNCCDPKQIQAEAACAEEYDQGCCPDLSKGPPHHLDLAQPHDWTPVRPDLMLARQVAWMTSCHVGGLKACEPECWFPRFAFGLHLRHRMRHHMPSPDRAQRMSHVHLQGPQPQTLTEVINLHELKVPSFRWLNKLHHRGRARASPACAK